MKRSVVRQAGPQAFTTESVSFRNETGPETASLSLKTNNVTSQIFFSFKKKKDRGSGNIIYLKKTKKNSIRWEKFET